MPQHQEFIEEAIRLSTVGLADGKSGPFGAVIVKDNQIVGQGSNQVVRWNDPTAHAEMVAIKDACKNLSTFELKGCTIYTLPLFLSGAVIATTGGYSNFVWATVPASLVGNKMYTQIAAFAPGFTTMRFSQGMEMSFGNGKSTPFLVSHRYMYGFGTTTFNPDKTRLNTAGKASRSSSTFASLRTDLNESPVAQLHRAFSWT